MKRKILYGAVVVLCLVALPLFSLYVGAAEAGTLYTINGRYSFGTIYFPDGTYNNLTSSVDSISDVSPLWDYGFRYFRSIPNSVFAYGRNCYTTANTFDFSSLSSLNNLNAEDFEYISFSFLVGIPSDSASSITLYSNNFLNVDGVYLDQITSETANNVRAIFYYIKAENFPLFSPLLNQLGNTEFNVSIQYGGDVNLRLLWSDLSVRVLTSEDALRSEISAVQDAVNQMGQDLKASIDNQTDELLNADASADLTDFDGMNNATDNLGAAEDAVTDMLPTIEPSVFVTVEDSLLSAFNYIQTLFDTLLGLAPGISSLIFFSCSFGLSLVIIGRAVR